MPEHLPEYPPMEHGDFDYAMMHSSHMMHHGPLVKTIQDCEAICEHMTTMLKAKHDIRMRVAQLQLLRDCADICGLTAKYIARNSIFSKGIAHSCAHICEVCGRECARFADPESQHCARVCLNCARECRAFVMMA